MTLAAGGHDEAGQREPESASVTEVSIGARAAYAAASTFDRASLVRTRVAADSSNAFYTCSTKDDLAAVSRRHSAIAVP